MYIENTFSAIDHNGVKHDCDVLFTFDCKTTGDPLDMRVIYPWEEEPDESQAPTYDELTKGLEKILPNIPNEHTYIVYTDRARDSDGSIIVQAAILEEDDHGNPKLLPITTDIEYDMIDTLLYNLQNALRNK